MSCRKHTPWSRSVASGDPSWSAPIMLPDSLINAHGAGNCCRMPMLPAPTLRAGRGFGG